MDLFRGPYFMLGDGSMGRHYDVASDGRFLMLKDTRDAAAAPAHFVIVQSWMVEVERLLRSRAPVPIAAREANGGPTCGPPTASARHGL